MWHNSSFNGRSGGGGQKTTKDQPGQTRSLCFCPICGHRERSSVQRACTKRWCPRCGARLMKS